MSGIVKFVRAYSLTSHMVCFELINTPKQYYLGSSQLVKKTYYNTNLDQALMIVDGKRLRIKHQPWHYQLTAGVTPCIHKLNSSEAQVTVTQVQLCQGLHVLHSREDNLTGFLCQFTPSQSKETWTQSDIKDTMHHILQITIVGEGG